MKQDVNIWHLNKNISRREALITATASIALYRSQALAQSENRFSAFTGCLKRRLVSAMPL